MIRNILTGLWGLGFALILGACGQLENGSSSGDVEANLMVGTVGQKMSTSSSALLAAEEDEEELVPSDSAFSFAQIDGLKLTLGSIEFRSSDESQTARVDLNDKEIEIGADVDEIPINQTMSIDPGEYHVASVDFDASYEIKARCRTKDHLVYTTEEDGVNTKECSSNPDLCDGNDDPEDYGYHSYDFLYVTTSGERENEETFMDISIEEPEADIEEEIEDEVGENEDDESSESDLNIALLVDTSYLASCYDGTADKLDSDNSGDSEPLAPFHWGTAEEEESPFEDGQADFGIGYIPLFVWASTDSDEELPDGETYVAHGNENEVDDVESLNFRDLLITTFTFRDDGSLLAARSRNFDDASVNLEQFYTQPLLDEEEEEYRFYNGEWFGKERSDDSEGETLFFQDRLVTGFKRHDLEEGPIKASIEDGPDCREDADDKEDLVNEHDTKPKLCLDDTKEIYWKRIRR